jgi:integrase
MPRPKKDFARYSTQPYRPTGRKFNRKTDRRWAVIYPHPTKVGKVKTETYRTESEAIDRTNELNAIHKTNKKQLQFEHWTIADALDFWLTDHAVKLASYKAEKSQANWLKGVIGEVKLSDFGKEHCDIIETQLEEDDYIRAKAGRGRQSYFITLRTALNYCKGEGIITTFYNISKKFIDGRYESRDRVATKEEMKELLEACKVIKGGRNREHLAPVIEWLHETACRSGELKTIRVGDIDLDRGFVKIRQSKRKKGSNPKPRECGISPRLYELIAEMNLMDYDDETLVIAEPLGFDTAFDFKRSFATACRIAKIADLNIHDLRRTGITNMLEKGLDVALVASMVGHEAESVMTLKIYTKFRHKHIAQEMLKMAA